jgi:hypothetical protein
VANAVTHTTAVRTVLADAVCNASTGAVGANGKLIIYSGTMPTNAQTALSGNTAIATITAVNFGAASSGVSTVTSSTADSSAVGGTASFFRMTASNGTTVIIQGTVGTSSSDMTISSTTIAAGANVSLTSGTYTAPV